jgi:L-alanine-DL-glutamate epimerase-like enolase superfamily enzyme
VPGIESFVDSMRDLVVGTDPRHVRGTWERLAQRLFKAGAAGPAASAASAIDVALWDLKAQHSGDPLWRLLGGDGLPVRAYASGLDLPLDDDDLRRWYERAAQLGIRAAKVKIGRNLEDDLRRLAVVREALGGGAVSLMADANERWTVKQAIRWVSSIEKHFELEWIEEPVSRWDYSGLRRVSDAVAAAVATGENINDPHLYTHLVRTGAADLIQAGLGVLGVTGCLRVIELCSAHDIPFALGNSPGNLSAHLATVAPTHTAMEVIELPPARVWRSHLQVADGRVVLNTDPGHGVRLDQDTVAGENERLSREPILSQSYERVRLSERWPDSGPSRLARLLDRV